MIPLPSCSKGFAAATDMAEWRGCPAKEGERDEQAWTQAQVSPQERRESRQAPQRLSRDSRPGGIKHEKDPSPRRGPSSCSGRYGVRVSRWPGCTRFLSPTVSGHPTFSPRPSGHPTFSGHASRPGYPRVVERSSGVSGHNRRTTLHFQPSNRVPSALVLPLTRALLLSTVHGALLTATKTCSALARPDLSTTS